MAKKDLQKSPDSSEDAHDEIASEGFFTRLMRRFGIGT